MITALADTAAYPPTVGGLITVPAIPLVEGHDFAYWLERCGAIPQLRPAAAVAMGVAPVAVLAAVLPLAAPRLLANQFPPLLAVWMVFLTAILPFQVGTLARQTYRRNNDTSLRGVVCFQQPMPAWQSAGLLALLVGWGLLTGWLLQPLENSLRSGLFAGLPAWAQFGHLQATDAGARMFSFGLTLVIGGVLLPVVEELFFRGYMLPRMARFGSWAPAVNALFSAAAGLFIPWQFFTRLVIHLAVAGLAWEKHNIRVGILARLVLGISWAAGLMLV